MHGLGSLAVSCSEECQRFSDQGSCASCAFADSLDGSHLRAASHARKDYSHETPDRCARFVHPGRLRRWWRQRHLQDTTAPEALFVTANAWTGARPADAEAITSDEFRRRQMAGELQPATATSRLDKRSANRNQTGTEQRFLAAKAHAE